MRRSLLLLLLSAAASACLAWADDPPTAPPPPGLVVTASPAPPAGWAQIQITASRPAPIESGRLRLQLDPAIFEAVESAAILGIHGDEAGAVSLTPSSVELLFSSASAGVGRAHDLPVIAVLTVRLRAGLEEGRTTTLSGEAELGRQRAPLVPTTFRVASPSTPTIRSIRGSSPVIIEGSGFQPGATARLLPARLALPTRMLTPRRIEIDAPSLFGHAVRLENPDGSAVSAYASQPLADPDPRGYFPLFPPLPNNSGAIGGINPYTTYLAVRNPHEQSVRITMFGSAARVPPRENERFEVPALSTVHHRVEWPNYNVRMTFSSDALVYAAIMPNNGLSFPSRPSGSPDTPAVRWIAGLPIAPRKIVTVYGAALDRLDPASLTFNGEPARILYASPTQLNLAVPDSPITEETTTVRFLDRDLPAAPASPFLFTVDGSGAGPAIQPHRFSRGGSAEIFATGLGLDASPANMEVQIAGLPAFITEVSEPRIAFIVPFEAPGGDDVPIRIRVGERQSQPAVTIAIER